MKSNFQRTQIFVWGFLMLVIAVIVGAFIWTKFNGVGGTLPPIYGLVGNFSLTNQHAKIVSSESLHGRIWIADVIFTRCPLQCIRMTKRMRELQQALPQNDAIKLISITADPEYDTPEVLRNYGEQFGVDQNSWWFLTAPKQEINRLTVDGLKLVVYEKKPEEREVPADLFLHSTKFVLVDGQGRIRGWFDGENAQSKGEIVRAVKMLLREK